MDAGGTADEAYGEVGGDMDLGHVKRDDVDISHKEVADLEGDDVDVPHIQVSDFEANDVDLIDVEGDDVEMVDVAMVHVEGIYAGSWDYFSNMRQRWPLPLRFYTMRDNNPTREYGEDTTQTLTKGIVSPDITELRDCPLRPSEILELGSNKSTIADASLGLVITDVTPDRAYKTSLCIGGRKPRLGGSYQEQEYQIC
ncbi:hypothetical protein VNO77_27468 [Canavalia gladiata]|uniref:Uncharacterized protein n=1 Tax=Canavalia gladiata TaxID=3824 RepID=A0AAN9KXX2_CANGL